MSSTILGHFYTKNEKFNLIKQLVLIGFFGIVYLFSDNIVINENNFVSALLILFGSTCYVIGGVLLLKLAKEMKMLLDQYLSGQHLFFTTCKFFRATLELYSKTRLNNISNLFRNVLTGVAWLLRFRILKQNGLIFQSQVAYLIPIFGVVLSYIFLKEVITTKVLIS